jgi:hypothetical protein
VLAAVVLLQFCRCFELIGVFAEQNAKPTFLSFGWDAAELSKACIARLSANFNVLPLNSQNFHSTPHSLGNAAACYNTKE